MECDFERPDPFYFVLKVSQPGGCFVGGTLVHTKEGLKPIEDIRVGDWVLAQPEESGQRAYKRVVRTLQLEDKEVWSVEIFPKSELDQARREDRTINQDAYSRLVVTANHPFWVKGVGWTRADALESLKGLDSSDYYPKLELSNGDTVLLSTAIQISRTVNPGIGWTQVTPHSEDGVLVDLRNGGTSAEFDFDSAGRLDDNQGVDWWNQEHAYRCTVYNFEVEDFHTYYVGSLGVWVHNINCEANIGGVDAAIKQGIIPTNRPGLYFTKEEALGRCSKLDFLSGRPL